MGTRESKPAKDPPRAPFHSDGVTAEHTSIAHPLGSLAPCLAFLDTSLLISEIISEGTDTTKSASGALLAPVKRARGIVKAGDGERDSREQEGGLGSSTLARPF